MFGYEYDKNQIDNIKIAKKVYNQNLLFKVAISVVYFIIPLLTFYGIYFYNSSSEIKTISEQLIKNLN